MKNLNISIIVYITLISFTSCKNNHQVDNAYLKGNWKLTISMGNSLNTDDMKKINADSGFHAGLNILGFIPENSKWNFVNDSILIITFQSDVELPQDTINYHLNRNRDSIFISDKTNNESYKLSKYLFNQIKLDLSNNGTLCILTRNNKKNN
jgi:hypothetical protein